MKIPKKLNTALLYFNILKIVTLCVFFGLFTSCSDNGCIEADDFGEYQTQTLEVKSSTSFDSCEYNGADRLDLRSTSHGAGLLSCFTTSNASVYDGQGSAHTSPGQGCSFWQPMNDDGTANPNANNEVMGFCVSECLSQCNSRLTGGYVNPSPAWKSTDEREGNGMVTLKPGSHISVRAVGGITLGGLSDFGDLYLFPDGDSFLPNQKDSTRREVYLAVSRGDVMQIKLEGGYDGDNGIGLRSSMPGGRGSLAEQLPATRSSIANAFSRVAMYLEVPPVGFRNSSGIFRNEDFDGNVPFHQDYSLYSCDYNPSASSCTAGSFCPPECTPDVNRIGAAYTNLNGDLAQSYQSNFPINSMIGTNGGLIFSNPVLISRYISTNNPPQHFNINPGGMCASGFDCPAPSISRGRMVGDLSSNVTFNVLQSSQITFRYLRSECSSSESTIRVKVKTSSSASADEIARLDVRVPHSDYDSISAANGNPIHVSAEGGQAIEISRLGGPTTFNDPSGNAIDCGRSLAIKFTEYYNLPVLKSGLVSFANIEQASSSSGLCGIKFRIINPNGSHMPTPVTAETQSRYGITAPSISEDFYEYGDFNDLTAEEDSQSWQIGTIFPSDMSNKVYVRKGQMIRFAPESWEDSWNPSNTIVRRCGIGMVMNIEPRPAFLCRGTGDVQVLNPLCSQVRNSSGAIRGCEATSNACNDSSNQASFCPGSFSSTSACIGTFNFIEPTESGLPRTRPTSDADFYNRPNFVATSDAQPACSFVYNTQYSGTGSSRVITGYNLNSNNVAQCNNCMNEIGSAGLQDPFETRAGMSYCYNLENYTGKVSNLTPEIYTVVNHPSNADSPPIHQSITKGLALLNRFNDTLGNLGGHGDVVDDHLTSGNQDYFFGRNARLSLLYLDGDDFKINTIVSNYANNAVGSAQYDVTNRDNGFRVRFYDYLNYSNGENMEVIFCKESSSSSNDCRNHSRPTHLDNVSRLQDFSSANNSFGFDTFGNMYRTSGARSGIANCSGAAEGDTYLCHCRGNFDASGNESCPSNSGNNDGFDCSDYENCRYRLTFRISDPEMNECFIPRSTDDIATGSYNETISVPCSQPSSIAGQSSSANSMPECNGIKTRNLNYIENGTETPPDPPASGNDGQICGYNSNPTACKKEFKCSSKYSNNTGQYNVLVRVRNQNIEVSGLVTSVVDPVLTALDGRGTPGSSNYQMGQVERVYTLIISDPYYQAVLKMCLVLMITFYGLSYLMGLTEGGTSEIITKVIKIAFVLFFVSDQGWYWFNQLVVRTFKDGTNELSFMMATSFDNSPQLRAAIENGDYSDKSVLFSSIDKVLGLFFTGAVQKKISALLFSGLFGWLYILIIYYAFIAYIFAVCTAVLVYLTAQVFISILFILGPIFFIFTLFNQTKEMFDKWLQNLIGFSLQQIFLLVTLSFFNMMMYEIIRNALGYRVCWDEVWTINIIIRISLLSFWTIPNVPPLFDPQAEMGSSGRGEGIPSFFSILFIWIVAKLMKEFIEFMSNVAADIGGGIKASELSSGVSRSVAGFGKSITNSKKFKAVKHTIARNTTQALDKKLFDSGKLAKQDRKAKRHQDRMDIKNKKAMVKSGESAVNEYKKKYGANLATKSKLEQQKELNNIRDEAMTDKGNELGLKKDEIQRLKTEKGTKYRGDNLAGYLASRGSQSMKKGGAVSKSITEKNVSRDFTKKQARKAIKNADEKGRDALVKAAKEGEIFIQAGMRTRRAADHNKIRVLPFESKNYTKARKQLEREGMIKQVRGGDIVRSVALKDEEKKMIRDRVKENKIKDEEGKISKTSRSSTIASLELAAKTKTAIEKGDTGSGLIRRSLTNKNKFVGKSKALNESVQTEASKIKKNVKQQRMSDIKKQITDKQSSVLEQVKNSQHQEVAVDQEIKSIEKSFDKEFSQFNELREIEDRRLENREGMTTRQKLFSAGYASKEDENRAKELRESAKSPEYKKFTAEREAAMQKKASILNDQNALVENQQSINNIGSSFEKMQQNRDMFSAVASDPKSYSKDEVSLAKKELSAIDNMTSRSLSSKSGWKKSRVAKDILSVGTTKASRYFRDNQSAETKSRRSSEKISDLNTRHDGEKFNALRESYNEVQSKGSSAGADSPPARDDDE